MKIPQVMLIEVRHAPGNLARVLSQVAEMGLTIEGLEAQSRTQDKTLWELTLEIDPGEEKTLHERINSVEAARVVGASDRVFDRHEGGKIFVESRVQFHDLKTLHDVYTPGVARVCMAIEEDPSRARRYTNIGRSVAVVTDGTAALGLGDIGPVASMPIMEGKAALFRAFGELSATPILLGTTDPDEIVQTVLRIAPTFGAIQLEDISSPRCFQIERALAQKLNIPVLHDDQHGTAVVVLAALRVAAKQTGTELKQCTIGHIGLGAAGMGIARLLLCMGVKRLMGADLNDEALAMLSEAGGEKSTLEDVMAHADVVVATTGVPGLIKPDLVREGQVVLSLTNPDPEIEPKDALERGAAFAADGKNINNVLAFPGLFRGALDAGATHFTSPMLIAAAEAIARSAKDGELIPSPLDREAHRLVAQSVADAWRDDPDAGSHV